MERFINELNNTIDHERAFVELCKRVLLLDEFKSLLSLKLEIYSLLQKRNDDGL